MIPSSSFIQSQKEDNFSFSRRLKKFAVVTFPEEENCIAVVPKKWLLTTSQNNYLCRWPLLIDNKKIVNLVEKDSDPDDKWPIYRAHLIYTSNLYSYAETAMHSYQESCEDSRLSSDVGVEPHVIQLVPKQDENNVAGSQPVVEVKCSNCNELEKKVINLEQEILAVKNAIMDVKVLISNSTQDIMQKIEKNNELQVFDGFEQLKTIEDLQNFEERLQDQDEFSKMLLYLSSYSGKDAHATTRRILSILMSNSLARQYTWVGTPVKQCFQKYKLIVQLIVAALRHHKEYSDSKMNEIESWIAKWLRYATDREIGRKRKRSKE